MDVTFTASKELPKFCIEVEENVDLLRRTRLTEVRVTFSINVKEDGKTLIVGDATYKSITSTSILLSEKCGYVMINLVIMLVNVILGMVKVIRNSIIL